MEQLKFHLQVAKVAIRVFTRGHDNWRYLETVLSHINNTRDCAINQAYLLRKCLHSIAEDITQDSAQKFSDALYCKLHSSVRTAATSIYSGRGSNGIIGQWIKRASTVRSHISTILWCSQMISQEKNLGNVHSVNVLFAMIQLNDIVQPRLQNILPNMLLSTTYAVNKSNSKRISLSLECHQGSFRPVVKCSTATGSFKSIKFDVASWKDLIDSFSWGFQDAYRFQSEYGRPTKICMENHDLMFTT
ncbi:hypothetical protein TSAR_011105 [Trichomalopsis sarcophagae]|uniref:Uncharacterized protein n=1 Tax=Trichomalopsis sarcophagae TaxID=543379 RepID=A0A232EGC3_9HYME|nr:hypothetical protein TSAR_011105 [Trichomalopsis sarcophagae]